MPSKIAIAIVLLYVLSIVKSDYLCNCYCPTSTTYVGYGTYTSSSTTCNAQNCANGCVGAFTACTYGFTYGSCRSSGNGLTVPVISMVMALTATFVKRFI